MVFCYDNNCISNFLVKTKWHEAQKKKKALQAQNGPHILQCQISEPVDK